MDQQTIPDHLLRVGRSFEPTYRPVLEFEGWIVAMLRYYDDFSRSNFYRVERHQTSNEIFILTQGSADLIIFDGSDQPDKGYVLTMEQNVAYDIPRLVWHWVIMSRDAHIVLVERNNTTDETTDYSELTEEQRAKLSPLIA